MTTVVCIKSGMCMPWVSVAYVDWKDPIVCGIYYQEFTILSTKCAIVIIKTELATTTHGNYTVRNYHDFNGKRL